MQIVCVKQVLGHPLQNHHVHPRQPARSAQPTPAGEREGGSERDRDRERDTERDTERDRDRGRETGNWKFS